MKNRIRRFISLLVSFALFVGQFSLSSFAANEIQPISNAQEYYEEYNLSTWKSSSAPIIGG